MFQNLSGSNTRSDHEQVLMVLKENFVYRGSDQ